MDMMIQKLRDRIEDIPDFPKPGIMFRDICPVLLDHELSKYVTDTICDHIKDQKIDAIIGLDSRGFLFGMTIAQQMEIGFIPVRKKGKLPGPTNEDSYNLEYGSSEQEIQKNVITPGMRVHIHDDLIATGGSVESASRLVEMCGGEIVSYSFIIDIDLGGKSTISKYSSDIITLVEYKNS